MDEITEYHRLYSSAQARLMGKLREELDKFLGKENSRLWHGAPVWFVGENPVAGYSVNNRGVCLLFWNGKKFKDDSLHPVGKFFAAELRYADIDEIEFTKLRALLKESKTQVWDSVGHMRKARIGPK